MMVLDTHQDWRFAKNVNAFALIPIVNRYRLTCTFQPLASGAMNIRFYAGAPLRTQDGYNIGTLAVFDDVPREDFTPRQRHTLKEFAVGIIFLFGTVIAL